LKTCEKLAKELGVNEKTIRRDAAYASKLDALPVVDRRRILSGATNWVDRNCKHDDWYTPAKILACVRTYFGGVIPLDPATNQNNPTQAQTFFTPKEDGLVRSWHKPVYVNPPFSGVLPDWTAKIYHEAANEQEILALLPCGARFSTSYWQDNILTRYLTAICFFKGRVAFLDAQGEPLGSNLYDSALYCYNGDCQRFAKSFRPLGKVVSIKGVY
jgi:hypothetical protein